MSLLDDIQRLMGGIQPDSPNDPGVYGPEYQYQPDRRSENPYVPQNWGDIAGQLLGSLGNIRRAQRNAQAQSLMRAYDQAVSQGPEAAQGFLNNPNLPSWFKDKVLPGISAQTFQAGASKNQRALIDSLRKDMGGIYAQAAKINDPALRDQFIDREIESLRSEYGSALADSLLKVIPHDPTTGHYVIPGVAKPLDVGGLIASLGLKPKQGQETQAATVLARVKDMLANGQLDNQGALDMIEKSGAFSTPANRQDFLRQKLQAALSDPNSGIDLAALERQMTAAGMNWQIELATARANLAKGAVTSGRFVSVDPQTGQVVPEGTPGAIQVTSDAYFKASRAGAKPNIAVLQMQYRTAQSREAEARRAIRMIQTSLTAGATPQGKAELAQAQSDLQQALQDERSILRQIQDVQSGVSSDTGGAGAGSGVGAGAGPGTPAPGTPAPAGQADRIAAGIRAALQKGQTRAQVIGYLATHWGQIADGDKLALVNQGVITVAEYKRLGPVKGQLPGQSAAKVQPQQPVDPPVKAILASMQSGPGPLQQIGAAIGSAVGSAAHAIGGVLSGYGALPPFDVTNPTVRHDVLVLVKVWPRLNPAQRQQIARAKRLSPQQVSWLTAHAGQLVGAPR